MPDSFKGSVLLPLQKKVVQMKGLTRGGLSFIDRVGKIFTSVLNNRLRYWLQNKIVLTEFRL